MDVLQLDVSGGPPAWISSRKAALRYASANPARTLGRACRGLRGGLQRSTGRQSRTEVHTFIAARGQSKPREHPRIGTCSGQARGPLGRASAEGLPSQRQTETARS